VRLDTGDELVQLISFGREVRDDGVGGGHVPS
jgi:hypothetical protein